MAEDLLKLEMSAGAEIKFSMMGPDNQRKVEGWFEHLRHWRDDEYVRTHSRRRKADENIYFLPAADFVIAFELADDTVTILSIFHKDTVRMFENLVEQPVS